MNLVADRTRRDPGPGNHSFAPRVSKCVTVAFWRNRDTLPLWGKRCATPGWATNATGAGTCSRSASANASELGLAAVVPLSHPSGASGWLNSPANREHVAVAAKRI